VGEGCRAASALAQHLSLVRPALVSQISVMLAVVPEQHTSGDDFTQSLRGWQRAVVQCRAAFGTLPLWTVTWVSLLWPARKLSPSGLPR
jgi:hypothetical protein